MNVMILAKLSSNLALQLNEGQPSPFARGSKIIYRAKSKESVVKNLRSILFYNYD